MSPERITSHLFQKIQQRAFILQRVTAFAILCKQSCTFNLNVNVPTATLTKMKSLSCFCLRQKSGDAARQNRNYFPQDVCLNLNEGFVQQSKRFQQNPLSHFTALVFRLPARLHDENLPHFHVTNYA